MANNPAMSQDTKEFLESAPIIVLPFLCFVSEFILSYRLIESFVFERAIKMAMTPK